MPHVIYLHSDLTRARRTSDDLEEAKKHFRMERFDIVFAMNIAFLVNAAMVVVAAAVFLTKDPLTRSNRRINLWLLCLGIYPVERLGWRCSPRDFRLPLLAQWLGSVC